MFKTASDVGKFFKVLALNKPFKNTPLLTSSPDSSQE
ncbi:MAG: hypothetical protein ACI8X3_001963 [Saprospiraceae bacterium]|jgi:hypothetical protein